MHQPGVTVRPLREMTGRAMFNEVFLDRGAGPGDNVIGGLNNGWAVANTTLMVERVTLGSGGGGRRRRRRDPGFGRPAPRPAGRPTSSATPPAAAGAVGVSDRQAATSPLAARASARSTTRSLRQDLVELHTLNELNRWNVARARAGQGLTGVEGNLAKLLQHATLRLARDDRRPLLGPEPRCGARRGDRRGVQELIVFSPGPSIYGGTDQVQRNIVGERGLGLPKEPGASNKVPYKDLPKNG